jgi:hypothetical protein
MKGLFKGIVIVGAIVGIGYLGYRAYQVISDMTKLRRTLPDFLKDLLDERPQVDVNLRLNSLSIAIGMSTEAYEALDFDLNEQVMNFVVDYYPVLAKLKITTQKYIKSSDSTLDARNEVNTVEDYDTVEVD